MASAAAQRYFNSLTPEQQQEARASWGGRDRMDEWFNAAVAAGAIGPDGTMGSRTGSAGGDYNGPNDAEAQGYNYSQNVSGSSGLKKGQTPTPIQLRRFAKEQGWSEDFNRYSDAQVQAWIDRSWDPDNLKFKSEHGGALVEKPTEVGAGEIATWDRGAGGGPSGAGGAAAPTYTPPKPYLGITDPTMMGLQKSLEQSFARRANIFGDSAMEGKDKSFYSRGLQGGGMMWSEDANALFPDLNPNAAVAAAVPAAAPQQQQQQQQSFVPATSVTPTAPADPATSSFDASGGVSKSPKPNSGLISSLTDIYNQNKGKWKTGWDQAIPRAGSYF